MKELLLYLIAPTFLVSFVVSFVLTKLGIPFLKRKRMGQMILEIGPEWHKKKEGTPTMGGIFFLSAALLTFLIVALFVATASSEGADLSWLCVLLFALANGAIGFVDDYVKFIKHQNKGLSALQKLIFQFAFAALFLFGMHLCGTLTTTLVLPFGLGVWDLGIFYYLFLIVFVVLFVNAVNLTDGLDGLAGSNVSVVLLFFVLFGLLGSSSLLFDASDAMRILFSVCILGGVLAFLCFNRYPAKIFMGDTGSLFLGAALSALAVWSGFDLILLLCGIVFLFEALSVVLQVGYFKLTGGKRLFKMAPFHHHLEKCSMSENAIVCLFCVVTTLGCVAAFFAF